MRIIKPLIVFVLFVVVVPLVALLVFGIKIAFLIFIMLLSYMAFIFYARRHIPFKAYFLSKFNLVSSVESKMIKIDIESGLLFEKISEILEKSIFKIVDEDKLNLQFLAITDISMKSWGENIYIEVKPMGNRSLIDIRSVTILQVLSLGKNNSNIKNFEALLEESLTI